MPGYEDYLLPGQNGGGRQKPAPLTGYLPAKAKRRKGRGKASNERAEARARARFKDDQQSAQGEVRDAARGARKDSRREETRGLIDAEVKLRYGGETSALKRQAANVPGYFDDYRRRLAEIQQGQQATYGAAIGQLGVLGQSLNTGALGSIASQSGADSGMIGDAAKANQVRQAGLGNYGGLIAGQGLAEQSYLANRSASSGPLQIQAQTEADRARADLKGEKGAYRSEIRSGIKSSRAEAKQTALEADRRYELEKAAFGLDVTKESNDAKDDRRQTREDRRARRSGNRQKAADRASREGMNDADNATSRANNRNSNANRGSGSDAGLTPAQRRDARKDRREATSRITDAVLRWDSFDGQTVPKDPEDASKGTRPVNPTDRRNQLVKEGYKPSEIHLALLMRENKRFTKADMRTARNLGIKVPKRLRPVKLKKGVKAGKVGAGTGATGNVAA